MMVVTGNGSLLIIRQRRLNVQGERKLRNSEGGEFEDDINARLCKSDKTTSPLYGGCKLFFCEFTYQSDMVVFDRDN